MSRSGRYRGRRRIAQLLSGIGIVLIIASVLTVTAFLFLRDYIIPTDDGLLLSIPLLDKLRPSPAPAATPNPVDDENDVDLIVETPITPAPEPEPEPEPIPVSGGTTVTPAFLSQQDLNKAARLDELIALCGTGEIDTVIIEVKSTSGVIATGTILANAAERLGGRAKLVAYFSALEDNTITRQRERFGIKHTSGVNWLDANKSRWINPYVPETREWLAAQLSAIDPEIFAAVLIDKLWFPPDGRLEVMVLDDDPPREEILETLKSELILSTTLPCWLIDISANEITYQGDTYADFPAGAFG